MRLAAFVLSTLLTLTAGVAAAADKVVHVYNWSDYIAGDTIKKFERATGIKVVYDVYDSNEALEAKLLAGKSGYDVVFPSAQPFAQRQLAAGVYRPLDRAKLPGFKNLDPAALKTLAAVDGGNRYLVPYMQGTTGIGYNADKVKKALGADAPVDSWRLIFDPAIASKLAACGIAMLDDEQEGLAAALFYLGKDPNSADSKYLEAAAALFKKARPHIKYFHSSQYINDLANGDICVAHGYSGDVIQARNRAEEAGNKVNIVYRVPKEGALVAIDVMAIPKDAPHPEAAHAFIDFLLRPEIIAEISDYVAYANANRAATPLLDEAIRTDPGIYPPPEVQARLATGILFPQDAQRARTRLWTRIKSGR